MRCRFHCQHKEWRYEHEILRFHSRREFCVLNIVFLFSVLQKNSVPTESLNRVFLPLLAWNIVVLVEVTASLVMVQVL
jgi:hypothetical protein